MRPGLAYKFHIINDNVVNAFAVPGGHIYFYRGLIEMTETEDELAGVMAHEISHIVGRHSMQQMKSQRKLGFAALGGALLGTIVGGRLGEAIYYGSNMTTNLFMTKYSRDDEREADFLGIYALYQAGYNPSGMSSLFEKFGKLRETQPSAMESWFQTHPQPEERVQNALKEQSKIPERKRYLDRAADFARMKKALALQDKPYEVREKPGEFVTITQPRWEYNTNAWVTIANKSKYTVSHLGVYVNYVDRAGKNLVRAGLLVREEPLPPGQSCEINMGQAIRDNAKVQADHVTVELAQAIPRP
jgi:predicted Zn-dependent protease